jgi:3-oxoisoapionate kinase
MSRLISFYGDDFTGSTDVMEVLSLHGVTAVLFTRKPTAAEFAPYADYQAIGLAGASRSQSPAWMTQHLPDVFNWLKSLGARFCHYKVCSTFDSAPEIGSIGRAIEIAAQTFAQRFVPLVVGAPQLRRFTFAGNLFAGYGGEIFRIDRHPVMSRHPVTPMMEADIRLHLEKQTGLKINRAFTGMDVDGVHLFDVHDKATQYAAGQWLLNLPQHALPFLCGSSGVEYALLRALQADNATEKHVAFAEVASVERLLVVSGSVSPTTEMQIRHALKNGFQGIAIDPVLLTTGSADAEIARAVGEANGILQHGGSPLIYTALGPSSDKSSQLLGDRAAIGGALGRIAKSCIERHGLTRLVVAGGDTSSHALAALEVLALKTLYPLVATPGSPLCSAVQEAGGSEFELALKGGQVGNEKYFTDMKMGFPAISREIHDD